MTRLIEAAQIMQYENTVPKLIKASSDLGISKAIAVRWLSSDVFFNMRIAVDKLPLLAGDILAKSDSPSHVVVVDLNKNKVNRSATYTPKVTVVCGADIVRATKEKGSWFINCWVGSKAAKVLKVEFSKELQAGLDSLSKMGYNPHPTEPGGIFNLPTTMMHKSASFPDAVDYGAPGSELNNPGQFMSMLNIEEALSMYLNNLKNGIWKPISSQWAVVPPSLTNATNEAGLIAKDKKLQAFSPLDFVYFQQTILNEPVKHKYVNGQKLSASKFAFVGDYDDPSTWLFRADSVDAIKASVRELQACRYLSSKAKQLTIGELNRRNSLLKEN